MSCCEEMELNAAEDFFERCDKHYSKIADEFLSPSRGRILSWPVVRAARLKRIWLDYGKTGVVRDEKGMAAIADQVLEIIARYWVTTELCGHTPHNARPEFEEACGKDLSEQEWQALLDMLEDDCGSYLCSDYAWRYLKPLYRDLFSADTAEQQLHVVDKILNVVHQRSDLAAVFVEGGVSTLKEIAQQGGYTGEDENEEA